MKQAAIVLMLVLATGCAKDSTAQRDKYFSNAQKHMEAGRYEEASIEFRNALKIDKGHIPSLLGLAGAFQKSGDHQNAIAAYQEVIKLDGKNITAKLELGEYMLAAATRNPELFKRVQETAEEVLALEPSNVEALTLLGNALSGQGQREKAIQSYEKALSLDPKNLKATLNLAAVQFAGKDVKAAEATFQKALQQHPTDIQAHLAIAAFYAGINKTSDAESYLRKAFDLAPADGRALHSLVNFYLASGKQGDAENVFREAIQRMPKEREPRWGLANFYLQQGKTEAGIQVLNDMLKENKSDRDALLRLAEIYLSRNEEAKAEEKVQEVLGRDKNDAGARFLKGRILRRKQEYDKAMVEFDAAIRSNPSLLNAYLEKANLQVMRGELDACESTLKEVLARDRNHAVAKAAYAKLLVLRQKPKEALALAQEVLGDSPDNEDALGARAQAYTIAGRYEEARKDWARLAQMQPRNPDYFHRLGIVEGMMGNKAAAMANFRKALELQPVFTTAAKDMLYFLIRDKQYDAALAELDKIGPSFPSKDEYHKLRGQVLFSKGDTAAAEAEFRKGVSVNPKNYQIYILLAQLNLRRNNLSQAIKEVDQAIAANEKFAPAHMQKAYYLSRANDTAGAIDEYRKALALDPENPIAANNLAWLLCENNTNFEEALSLARTARKKLPEEPEAAETLGWIYYKMKNYTLAADQLLFSVNNRKQPSAENYYRLGMALHAKGDKYHARQTLQKALSMNPDFPGAEEARKVLSEK